MLKEPFRALTSRVDRALSLLERIATALEQIAKRGPDHLTIHQTLPAPEPAPQKTSPWPGIQPHYPFPNYPGINPNYPGINPNVPGLGPYWTSQVSAVPPPTLYGLPVKTDPRVKPGTVYLSENTDDPTRTLQPSFWGQMHANPQATLESVTSASYVARLLKKYLNDTEKYLNDTKKV